MISDKVRKLTKDFDDAEQSRKDKRYREEHLEFIRNAKGLHEFDFIEIVELEDGYPSENEFNYKEPYMVNKFGGMARVGNVTICNMQGDNMSLDWVKKFNIIT